MKDKNFIIYGIRIRLGSSVNLKILIFNREVQVSSRDAERYVDLAFSEEEMIYGWLSDKIKFTIPPINKSKLIVVEYIII